MRIKDEVTKFIVDNFLFGDCRGLRCDTSFLEGGVIDSAGIMQLVVFINEHFRVIVRDEEVIPENLDSIDKVCAFVARKMDAREIEAELPAG